MDTQMCSRCGGEIIFRHDGFRVIPIHLSGVCGGWASHDHGTYRESSRGERFLFRFASRTDYLEPNATCPVCGQSVFFYESPFGGRVFFDELGPPWPKHPCTISDELLGRELRHGTKQSLVEHAHISSTALSGGVPSRSPQPAAKPTAVPAWVRDHWFPFLVEEANATAVGLKLGGRPLVEDRAESARFWRLHQFSAAQPYHAHREELTLSYCLAQNSDTVLCAMTEEIVYLRRVCAERYDVSTISVSLEGEVTSMDFQLDHQTLKDWPAGKHPVAT